MPLTGIVRDSIKLLYLLLMMTVISMWHSTIGGQANTSEFTLVY